MKTSKMKELALKHNDVLEQNTAEEVLQWAANKIPNLTLACSFGAEDIVLVHMLQNINPNVDVFYLDTNFHFQETYETRDKLIERYKIQFIQVLPSLTPEEQQNLYGDKLWETNPNLCCQLRKVDPLTIILKKYDAWITGIRRDQTPTRANAKKLEFDDRFGLIKFNPLVDWSTEDVWNYIYKNQLIYNPLHDQSYPSIGCKHCTRPVKPGEDPRAGRWSNTDKNECGLHLDANKNNSNKGDGSS